MSNPRLQSGDYHHPASLPPAFRPGGISTGSFDTKVGSEKRTFVPKPINLRKKVLMETQQLRKILGDISKVKIALAGDFCLDAYWFIDEAMSEVSVETNEPTRPVRQQRICHRRRNRLI